MFAALPPGVVSAALPLVDRRSTRSSLVPSAGAFALAVAIARRLVGIVVLVLRGLVVAGLWSLGRQRRQALGDEDPVEGRNLPRHHRGEMPGAGAQIGLDRIQH